MIVKIQKLCDAVTTKSHSAACMTMGPWVSDQVLKNNTTTTTIFRPIWEKVTRLPERAQAHQSWPPKSQIRKMQCGYGDMTPQMLEPYSPTQL